LRLLESYEATYEEADGHKGIWLINGIEIRDNQSPTAEILTADFREIKVGVDVPDEMFTFEGLGVPPGTKIADKTLPGQPIKYYYGTFPVGAVDSLAEEIQADLEADEPNQATAAGPIAGAEAGSGRPAPVAEVGRGKERRSGWWVFIVAAVVFIAGAVVVRTGRFRARG